MKNPLNSPWAFLGLLFVLVLGACSNDPANMANVREEDPIPASIEDFFSNVSEGQSHDLTHLGLVPILDVNNDACVATFIYNRDTLPESMTATVLGEVIILKAGSYIAFDRLFTMTEAPGFENEFKIFFNGAGNTPSVLEGFTDFPVESPYVENVIVESITVDNVKAVSPNFVIDYKNGDCESPEQFIDTSYILPYWISEIAWCVNLVPEGTVIDGKVVDHDGRFIAYTFVMLGDASFTKFLHAIDRETGSYSINDLYIASNWEVSPDNGEIDLAYIGTPFKKWAELEAGENLPNDLLEDFAMGGNNLLRITHPNGSITEDEIFAANGTGIEFKRGLIPQPIP